MDDLQAMKGSAALVAAIVRDGHITSLHRFSDGSWKIDRNDKLFGIWEHNDIKSCLKTFFQTSKCPAPVPLALWLNFQETPPTNTLRDVRAIDIHRN